MEPVEEEESPQVQAPSAHRQAELISAALQGDPEDAVPMEFLDNPYGDEESKEDGVFHQHFSFSNNVYHEGEEETVSPRELPPNPEETKEDQEAQLVQPKRRASAPK